NGITTTTSTAAVTLGSSEAATINAISAAASLAVAVGELGVAISGAGAEATNVILETDNAYVLNTVVGNSAKKGGDVKLSSTNSSSIQALIAAVSAAVGAGGSGVGVAIGVSVARNYIGWDPDGGTVQPTDQSTDRPGTLTKGDMVQIAQGPRAGDIYQY